MKQSVWSQKVKRLVVNNSVGFDQLLLSKMEIYVSLKIPTMAIQEDKIILNPFFCSKLSNDVLMHYFKHEIKHVLLNNIKQMPVTPEEKVEILRKINLI